MEYTAHKREADGKEINQPLTEHLKNVGELCAKFAEPVGLSECGRVTGLLHDIGKYQEDFQKKIKENKNIRVDHSTPGAFEACKLGLNMSTFCIAGHHGGLPNMGNRTDTSDDYTVCGRLKRKVGDYSFWKKEQPDFTANNSIEPRTEKDNKLEIAFLTKMLYSCLVDADFLDTEAFMNDKQIERNIGTSMEELLASLNQYIKRWEKPNGRLNALRSDILNECINEGKSNKQDKLFTLTVPTGGGKTVSSLAFALNYAVENKKTRVIYVVPYTSIIEQNSQVFRNILGDKNVLEHHSNVSFDENHDELNAMQLACENWDYPLIVTTAVQFFESLYSNKPSSCRKIHNIANSVVIFDEAQMLPVKYIKPCVDAMWQLTNLCNTAVVLCTATQPNLEGFFDECSKSKARFKEISSSASKSTEAFKRVNYVCDGELDDDALSARLLEENEVLCIVNTKAHARRLFDFIGASQWHYHLSTYMHPNHRRKVIEEIKNRLEYNKAHPENPRVCRVISTSLTEAGVDMDFPTVYRAVSGIDSILQAGGRCNRESKHDPEKSLVHIFKTDKIPKMQRLNVEVSEMVLSKYGDKIYLPEAISFYFERLYKYKVAENAFDEKKILENQGNFSFEQVARDFKMIDNDTIAIYIPTEENQEDIAQLREGKCHRELFRRLQGFCVNVYKYEFDRLMESSALEVTKDGFYILADKALYDSSVGIKVPDSDLGSGIFLDF